MCEGYHQNFGVESKGDVVMEGKKILQPETITNSSEKSETYETIEKKKKIL